MSEPRRIKVKLTKTLTAEVEVDAPDEIADELDWYDEAERRAWDTQDREGAWSGGEDTAEVQGDWRKPATMNT